MREPILHRSVLFRFRWDDPLVIFGALVFEFLALGLVLALMLPTWAAEFVSVWYLVGASTFALLCGYWAVSAWRDSHPARAAALGFPGLLAISAPVLLFLGGSVWFDGTRVHAGMTPRQVLETMESQWLYHWPDPRRGPDATRVSDLLRTDTLPPWSHPTSRTYTFTHHPPSADVVDVLFGEENAVLDVTYSVD